MKQKWPEEHRCFWHFLKCYSIENRTRLEKKMTAATITTAYGWEKNQLKSVSFCEKQLAYICNTADHMCVSFLAMRLDIFIYAWCHCSQYLPGFGCCFIFCFRHNAMALFCWCYCCCRKKISFSDWYLLKFHCQRCELNCRALEHIMNRQSYIYKKYMLNSLLIAKQ